MIFTDPEEKLLFAKASDRLAECKKKNKNTFTDFLDPFKTEKFLRAFSREAGLTMRAFGGHNEAERRMIGFSVDEDFSDEDFPIEALNVKFDPRFHKPPRHRDYLGSLFALGIDRAKTGDIILVENGAVIFVCREIAEFVAENFIRTGNAAVRCEAGAALFEAAAGKPPRRITVASLRLDAVVSGAFKISRSKSAALVESEKVFVNWTPAINPSKQLNEGDVVTVRGLGRIKIEGAAGKTKKDRFIINITMY